MPRDSDPVDLLEVVLSPLGEFVSPRSDATALPTYGELMASLDGCSAALARLMGAVRGLFESAGTADGYAAAVDGLKVAHDAAVDWCGEEANRHPA